MPISSRLLDQNRFYRFNFVDNSQREGTHLIPLEIDRLDPELENSKGIIKISVRLLGLNRF